MSTSPARSPLLAALRHPLTGLVGLLLCTGVLFAPTLQFDLLYWDDRAHLFDNPDFGDLGAAFTRAQQHIYMPLTWSAWALAWRAGGGDPAWLHGLNWVGHLLGVLACAFALAQLLALMGGPRRARASRWAVVAGAALFALHPLQVEPVAWVTSLKDVGAAGFGLLSLGLYARACRTGGWGSALGAGAAGLLAVLCKTTAIALLPVFAGIWLWAARAAPTDGSSDRRGRPLLVALLVLAGGALVPLWWTAAAQSGANTLPPVPLGSRAVVALDAYGFYLGKLLWPWPLLGSYGRTPELVLEGIAWAPTAGLVALALAAAAAARRRWPELGLGLLMMAALAAPTLGMVPFGAQLNTTVADRYVHLALVGPALALAGGLARLPTPRARRAGAGAFSVALIAWLAISWAQVPVWQTDATLWRHTLRFDPDNIVGLVSYAQTHSRQDRDQQALELLDRAIALAPRDVHAQNNRAVSLAKLGRLEEAILAFEEGLATHPGEPSMRKNLIHALRESGRLGALQVAVRGRASPALLRAAFTQLEERALAWERALRRAEDALARGDFAGAEAHARAWMAQSPKDAEMLTMLGVAAGNQGRHAEALVAFERAVALDPAYRAAQRNLDLARAQSPASP